jgi:glycosyltransferase involved in cell wall biosynthesis
LRKALEEYVEFSPDADIVVSIITPDKMIQFPGRRNYLITMFECAELPTAFASNLWKADVICVPCNHNRWLFGKYTEKPVEVIGGGVDMEYYAFRERQIETPFRFLWIGAPNPRKGYEVLTRAWKPFETYPGAELYLKTTLGKGIDWEKMVARWGEVRIDKETPLCRIGNNIIWDGRDVSRDELRDLYYSAHCFVFPSLGEGFGLTLAEAIATGCPAIAPVHTGIADFFDAGCGLTIPWKMAPLEYLETKVRAYLPQPVDTAKRMIWAMHHYGEMRRLAIKARRRLENGFTWRDVAQRLIGVIRKHEARQEAKAPIAACAAS